MSRLSRESLTSIAFFRCFDLSYSTLGSSFSSDELVHGLREALRLVGALSRRSAFAAGWKRESKLKMFFTFVFIEALGVAHVI